MSSQSSTYCLWESHPSSLFILQITSTCMSQNWLGLGWFSVTLDWTSSSSTHLFKYGNWPSGRSQASSLHDSHDEQTGFHCLLPTCLFYGSVLFFPREESIAFCPKMGCPYPECVGFPEVVEKQSKMYLGSEPIPLGSLLPLL